ncbi:zeta toxin family protein [Streptomyces sp. E-08]|uniref:zeta toxin family protein n=1 Tax=Streptomyces sp. E-08 TaxID=3404047 RepID=UPI003CF4B4EB
MTEVDRTRYVLSEEENAQIFREQIVPQQLDGRPQEQPIAVIVSGQTGAGKTAITALVTTALRCAASPSTSTSTPANRTIRCSTS